MASPSSSLPDRIQVLAARLPFAVDDAEAVNARYVRWVEAPASERADADKRIVDVWTYCFVYRYFVRKAARGSIYNPTDVEALVASTYRAIDEGRASITRPERYAQWVSVVCRNRFLNHVRGQRREVSLDDEAVAEPADPRAEGLYDLGFVHEALDAALGRLPDYLTEVARLLFLDGYSYREAAEATGLSVPTVRVYRQRAAERLRRDPALSTFWEAGGHEDSV
jgi:RNA polymerase sigma factor (sigma-70 family)